MSPTTSDTINPPPKAVKFDLTKRTSKQKPPPPPSTKEVTSPDPTCMASHQMDSQSSIIRHVPTRARNIDQILGYADRYNITNEMLIKIGLRMNRNLLFGSNHRCVAMLIVFKSIMDDIDPVSPQQQQPIETIQSSSSSSSPSDPTNTPTSADTAAGHRERPLVHLHQTALKKAMDFLDFCRPLSVSMTNAYKLIREEIMKLDRESQDKAIADLRLDQSSQGDESRRAASDDTKSKGQGDIKSDERDIYEEQKEQLKEYIDRFIDEEIWSAQRGICENINSNITTNDVILVYGCSTIVQNVLLDSKSRGKVFRVIVVDSPPHFNGRRMLKFLNDNSIDVSYTLINSLSYVMRQATKVLLGANSMLANGYVMSHIGTSQVALMAKATNVPTLVCCETYKLSDRVYVDSFGCNEVDGGHELGSALNLRYDLTPPEFVSMVINEKNTIPAESVPALLRFRAERTRKYPNSIQNFDSTHDRS